MFHRHASSSSPVFSLTAGAILSKQAIAYALGHILAGNIGTPTVVRATTTWYRRIALPPWTPPDKIFAPMWIFLYTCMGISVSMVAAAATKSSSTILRVWLVHLALNVIWPFVFFGRQQLRLGLAIQYALLFSLVAVILPGFYAVKATAAYLLLPYLAWLTLATKLNQAICALNPTDKNGFNEAKLQANISKLQRDAGDYADS